MDSSTRTKGHGTGQYIELLAGFHQGCIMFTVDFLLKESYAEALMIVVHSKAKIVLSL
jgi:hypothetical protein